MLCYVYTGLSGTVGGSEHVCRPVMMATTVFLH